jgi:hypothetical protein
MELLYFQIFFGYGHAVLCISKIKAWIQIGCSAVVPLLSGSGAKSF